MIRTLLKVKKTFAVRALLLAGLSLFLGASLQADDSVPVREVAPSVTPSPMGSPTPPPVSQSQLKSSEARLDGQMQSLLQEEQARNADMNKALDAMRAQLESLGKAQQDQALSLSTSASKLDDLDQKLAQSLQKVEDVRSDIEHKGERLENLLDLIDTVKRDLNDDSKEIAELKEETARLNGLVKAPSDETPWWDQLADWKYLPATATLLGVIAILVASSKP